MPPAVNQRTMVALSYPKRPMEVEHFPQQVVDVIGYLQDALQPDHPFASIKLTPGPTPETAPEVWLLGSSDYSARLAATLGLPFAFADFFGSTGKHGPAVTEIYRREFSPSALCPEPKVNVALQVICAPTEEEAQRVASSRNYNRARRDVGGTGPRAADRLAPCGSGVLDGPDSGGCGIRQGGTRLAALMATLPR